MENLHTSSVPTDPVNVYVVLGEHPFLIDAGVCSEDAEKLVFRALRKLGVREAKGLFITHGHVDHMGLANKLADELGCKVYMHPEDLDLARRLYKGLEEERLARIRLLVKHGLPENLATTFEKARRVLVRIADIPDHATPLRSGEKLLVGDYEAQAIHTPGHSPGSLCIYVKQEKVVFTGDTLLEKVTPNVGVGSIYDESASVEKYMKSLDSLEALSARWAFPGHSKPFEDVANVIGVFRKHYWDRERRVYQAVCSGEKTAFEVSKELFGEQDILQTALGLLEALDFLKYLESRGEIESQERGGKIVYRARRR